MGETKLQAWQTLPNQGYELYGKLNGRTVIGPGSREAIDLGLNGLASSDSPTYMMIAERELKLPNLWDGGYNRVQPGEVVMTYGKQDLGYMNQEWQEYAKRYGRNSLIDRNTSVSAKFMESTHINPTTGEYLIGELTDNYKGKPVIGLKRAHAGFAFLPEGTPVLSTEALKQGKAPVTSKPFQVVAMDSLGCYLTPAKTLKKYKPTTIAGEQVFERLGRAQKIVAQAQQLVNEGKAGTELVENTSRRAWKVIVNFAQKYGKALM